MTSLTTSGPRFFKYPLALHATASSLAATVRSNSPLSTNPLNFGRGSGKSHFFGELMVERCLVSPGTLAVCIREVQKSLLQSSKRLIESKIQSLGVGAHFQVLHDRIVTPGDGLIIFQGMQDSTAESIKSLEGFDIAWVEEAQTLSARGLSLLRPTIRKEGSELWANWNPRRKKDAIDDFLRRVRSQPSP